MYATSVNRDRRPRRVRRENHSCHHSSRSLCRARQPLAPTAHQSLVLPPQLQTQRISRGLRGLVLQTEQCSRPHTNRNRQRIQHQSYSSDRPVTFFNANNSNNTDAHRTHSPNRRATATDTPYGIQAYQPRAEHEATSEQTSHNDPSEPYHWPISEEQAPCSAHIERIVVTDECCPIQSMPANVSDSRLASDTISMLAGEPSVHINTEDHHQPAGLNHSTSHQTSHTDSCTMGSVNPNSELALQVNSLETLSPPLFTEVVPAEQCGQMPDSEPPPYYMENITPQPEDRPQHRRPHRRRSRRHPAERQSSRFHYDPYDEPDAKICCDRRACRIGLSGCLKFRRVLIMLAVLGACGLLAGVVLGVLRAPGNSFLTLALMFVGLGLMLLAVVLVGWKCTPPDHEPCHLLFGLGAYSMVTRRGARRRRERYYWVGGMLYSEFRHRRPPPSYATSMQDYQNTTSRRQGSVPSSPPPTYKSHTSVARPGIHIIFPRNSEHPNSRPPTYRLNNHTRPSIAILNETNQAENDNAQMDINSSRVNLTEAEVQNYNHADNMGITNPSFVSEEDHTAVSSEASSQHTHDEERSAAMQELDQVIEQDNVIAQRNLIVNFNNMGEVTEL